MIDFSKVLSRRSITMSRCVLVLFALALSSAAWSQAPYILSKNLQPGWKVMGGSQSSPDGEYVVYMVAEQDRSNFYLFSVPVAGGEPINLGSNISISTGSLAISNDSLWVVYRRTFKHADGSDGAEVVSVPIDGSTPPAVLNSALAGSTGAFKISSDSRRVVYLATQEDTLNGELYSVPIDRSEIPLKLSEGLGLPPFGVRFEITPDGLQVVYYAPHHSGRPGAIDVHSVPITGGTPMMVSNNFVANGGQIHTGPGLLISADSQRVIYRARPGEGANLELYSAPLNGQGLPVRLNTELAAGANVGGIQLSSNGQWVVYTQGGVDSEGLFSAPITGGTPVKLMPGRVAPSKLNISPDSKYVVFQMGGAYDGNLFSVPIRGGDPVKLNNVGGHIYTPAITHDGQRVIYSQNYGGNRLLSVSITGGTPVRLDTDEHAVARVVDGRDSAAIISSDSQWLIYRGDPGSRASPSVENLYKVAIIGGGVPVRLTDTSEEEERRIRNITYNAPDSYLSYSATSGSSTTRSQSLFAVKLGRPTDGEIYQCRDRIDFKVPEDDSRFFYVELGDRAEEVVIEIQDKTTKGRNRRMGRVQISLPGKGLLYNRKGDRDQKKVRFNYNPRIHGRYLRYQLKGDHKVDSKLRTTVACGPRAEPPPPPPPVGEKKYEFSFRANCYDRELGCYIEAKSGGFSYREHTDEAKDLTEIVAPSLSFYGTAGGKENCIFANMGTRENGTDGPYNGGVTQSSIFNAAINHVSKGTVYRLSPGTTCFTLDYDGNVTGITRSPD